MISLSSFSTSLRVAIIGASGGIGGAFVEMFAGDDAVEAVYAFSRSIVSFSSPKVRCHTIDVTDEGSIEAAANALDGGTLDIVIVASGFLHDDSVAPEKSLRDLSFSQFEAVFAVNTFGPALVAKHFLPLMCKDSKSVFAALSARVSSISDNHLGGWYAYRASKTALNMVIKTAAIEMARRYPQACVIGLHPGTVETALSEPFRGNVTPGRLFTPAFSAQRLIDVVNNVTPAQSGKLFAWDGQEIVP